jgi:hypothetical protein
MQLGYQTLIFTFFHGFEIHPVAYRNRIGGFDPFNTECALDLAGPDPTIIVFYVIPTSR